MFLKSAQQCVGIPVASVSADIWYSQVYNCTAWSFQPRDQTQVSCIAGGFFTKRATMEAK